MDKHLSNEELKELYKNYFQLYRESHKCVSKLDKAYKYTTGTLLLNSLLNIWKHITMYNLSGNLVDYYETYSYIWLIKVDLRFLNDELKVSNGYYQLFSEFITNIEGVWNNILI